MKLRDLEYLVAVYDLKGFGKAAARCFVSQPTLSGQLKKLEEELGVTLMERSTRSVKFTEAGERVVNQARQMLAGAQKIKTVASEFEDPLAGDFHLGLIPTIGPFLLPKIVTALHSEFPQMRLFLHELQTDVLIDRLLSGQLDAAVLAKLDWHRSLAEWHLYHEPFLLALPATHPLARAKKSLPKSVLDGESVLMLEDGHCLRDQAIGVCFAAGAHEDNRYQATSMDTLLHMISVGHGMTLVPEMAEHQLVNGVVLKRFKKPEPSREVVLVGRQKGSRHDGLKTLSEFIRRQVIS